MREIVELAARIAELERRFSGMVRHGTIEEVDPAKQIMRLNFGKDVDGKPFLSPWIPYAQIAGALKVHTPPSKGQQFTALSPNGDWRQAVAMPMTWSNQNPSPSDKGNENVLTFGSVTIRITADKVLIEAPTITLKGDINLGDEGGELVHRVGDADTDGDLAVGSASKVRAV